MKRRWKIWIVGAAIVVLWAYLRGEVYGQGARTEIPGVDWHWSTPEDLAWARRNGTGWDRSGAAGQPSCPSCPDGRCPVPQQPQWQPSRPAMPQRPRQHLPPTPPPLQPYSNRAVCRIRCGDGGMGSGTLVDVAEGKGLVVTAKHLKGQEPVVCIFNGRTFRGQWVADKEQNDLAAVMISDPGIPPVDVAEKGPARGEAATSIGFGPGSYRENHGVVLRLSGTQFWLSGGSRGGDSGGPVLNRKGQLIGVLWGTDGRETIATSSTQAHVFLTRAGRYFLSPYRQRVDNDMGRIEGRLDYLERQPPPQVIVPPSQAPPVDLSGVNARIGAVEQRQSLLEARQDKVRDTAQELAQKYEAKLPGITKDVEAAIANSKGAKEEVAAALSEDGPKSLLGRVKDRIEGIKEHVTSGLLSKFGWPGGIALAALAFFLWDLRQKVKTGDPLLIEKVVDKVHDRVQSRFGGTKVGDVDQRVHDRLERIDARFESLLGRLTSYQPPQPPGPPAPPQ